jgi:tetratricopeptide (TPR) repeat protein
MQDMKQQMLALTLVTLAMTTGTSAQQGTATDQAELAKQAQKLESDGKRKEALAVYRQILDKDPKYFDAHLGLGRVLDLEGQYAEARLHIQKAIELAPESEMNSAISIMAVSYAFEGNAAEAAKYYQKVFDRQILAGAPDSAGGTANALGRVYLETGDFENAEKWYRIGYERVTKIAKRTPAQTDLTEMRWHHAQARIAARRKQFGVARRHLADVRDIVGRGTLDEAQQAQYPHVAGYVRFYEGNYDLAIAQLSKASQQDPFILSLLAQSYDHKKDQATARELYRRILERPDHSLQAAFARPLAERRLAAQ